MLLCSLDFTFLTGVFVHLPLTVDAKLICMFVRFFCASFLGTVSFGGSRYKPAEQQDDLGGSA